MIFARAEVVGRESYWESYMDDMHYPSVYPMWVFCLLPSEIDKINKICLGSVK